jgi:hypothetical protein
MKLLSKRSTILIVVVIVLGNALGFWSWYFRYDPDNPRIGFFRWSSWRERLVSSDKDSRQMAADFVKGFVRKHKQPVIIVPLLVRRLDDEDRFARRTLAEALAELDVCSASVPPLVEALRDQQCVLRRRGAALALRIIYGRNELHFPPHVTKVNFGTVDRALREALTDSDKEVQWNAYIAKEIMRKLPSEKPTVPIDVIIFGLGLQEPEDFHWRWFATQALDHYGGEAKRAIPVLCEILNKYWYDPEECFRPVAVLARAGEEGRAALVKLTGHSHAPLRCHAIAGLGFRGADVKSTLPVLKRLLEDPDALVRKAAAFAIAQVEKPWTDLKSTARTVGLMGSAHGPAPLLATVTARVHVPIYPSKLYWLGYPFDCFIQRH